MASTTTDVVARLSVRDRPAFSREMQGAQGDVAGVGDAAEGAERKGSGAMGVLKGGVLAVGAAAIAVGAQLLSMGGQFDAAVDTIRVGTGATGDALAVLQEDMFAIRQTTVGSLEDVSTVVADLNTYLGLTGKPLQDLSSQILNLSRLTGTDLATNVTNSARLFGDWGIAAADMEGGIDAVFRASQATGIGYDTLSSTMVTSGVTLRELGFGFEESAALIGNFEKQGVNAEQVLGAMRQGLGRLARAGEDPAEAFSRIIGEIGTMDEDAARLASIELFGAKAGAEMFATIRDGRFDIEDLVDSVTNGTESIAGVTEATADWGEQFQLLKQRGFDALEPVATRVFSAVGQFMNWVGREAPPLIAMLQTRWEEAWPAISSAIETARGYIEPVMNWLGETVGWLWDFVIKPAHQFWVDVLWPGIVEAITAAWPTISELFTQLGDTISTIWEDTIVPAWHTWVDDVWPGVQDAIETAWPYIETVFGFMGTKIADTVSAWLDFQLTIVNVWGAIKDAAQENWAFIRDNILTPMTSGLSGVGNLISLLPGIGGGSDADTAAPSTRAPSLGARSVTSLASARPQITQTHTVTTGPTTGPTTVNLTVHAIDADSFRTTLQRNRHALTDEILRGIGQRSVTA